MLPFGRSIGEVIATAHGAGAANTTGSVASLLPASGRVTPFPAGTFSQEGQQVMIWAAGKMSTVITTPGTAQFDFTLGGSSVFTSGAIALDVNAAHTNKPWTLFIWLTLQVIGTAAQFMGHGMWFWEGIDGTPATAPKGVVPAMLPWNTAPALGTAFDASATLMPDLTFTQTVSTGSCQLQQYQLNLPN